MAMAVADPPAPVDPTPETLSVRLVELFRLPDTPLTVTLYDPVVAALLAVRVNALVVFVLEGLKAAVTPLGRPEAVSATLSLNPFWPITLIVLLALPPPTRGRLPAEDERVNVLACTVTAILAVRIRVPVVPVIDTV
jgi:hypothetical protein